MTSQQLHKIHRAQPFQPIVLHLADGRQIRVDHPEWLAHTPGTRLAVVTYPDESFEAIDLLLVTSIHVGNGERTA